MFIISIYIRKKNRRGIWVVTYKLTKKETNNKVLSSILIYAIRGTDRIIKTEKGFSKKEKKYLKPEYYKDGEGCGDWVIKRRGIALVVKFLLEVLDNKETRHELILEVYNYTQGSLSIEELDKEIIEDIQWCIVYLADILSMMVYCKKKKVKAKWV